MRKTMPSDKQVALLFVRAAGTLGLRAHTLQKGLHVMAEMSEPLLKKLERNPAMKPYVDTLRSIHQAAIESVQETEQPSRSNKLKARHNHLAFIT